MAFLRNLVARADIARPDPEALAYFRALQAEHTRLLTRRAPAAETPPKPAVAPTPTFRFHPEPAPQELAEGIHP
jgi:hypothetical protein